MVRHETGLPPDVLVIGNHVEAEDADCAALRFEKGCQDFQRRGFARAVRPDESMDRALLHREADAAQRLLAFVVVMQVANFNGWLV